MRTYEISSQINSYKNEFNTKTGYYFVAMLTRGFKTILVGDEYSLDNKMFLGSYKNLKKLFSDQYRNIGHDSVQYIQLDMVDSNIFIININSLKAPIYLYAVVDSRIPSEDALDKLYSAINKFLHEDTVCEFLLESIFSSKNFNDSESNLLGGDDELPPFMRTDSVLRMLALRDT